MSALLGPSAILWSSKVILLALSTPPLELRRNACTSQSQRTEMPTNSQELLAIRRS